jgi:aspartyl-tRNA(Asn)/glutamyl-tRNA(Gln) amidotransferase subunit A
MIDVQELTVRELGALIRTRKTSIVDLTKRYLDQIEKYNPVVNAYVAVTAEAALKEAEALERELDDGHYRGPLHGIPIAHKDLYCTRGVPTTCCSRVLADFVPDHDATVVRQWRDAGTVMLGKLNTNEFAYGARNVSSSFGPARNPWNPDFIAGGSSGGSSIAVLLGMCAAATGSDSGGSIRIPSSLCGVVGFKPTFGLGSRNGIFPLLWSADHPGPIGRSVADCALLLQPMAGYDPADRSTAQRRYGDFTRGLGRDINGLRVGVPRRYYFDTSDSESADAVCAALDVLRSLGAVVEEIEIPYIDEAAAASSILHLAEAASYHDDVLTTAPHLYTDETRLNLELGNYILAKDYLNAQRYRVLLGRSFRELFRSYDVIATPTTRIAAVPIEAEIVDIRGETKSVHLSLLHNTEPCDLAGLPAITVPCGFNSRQLPIGFQLMGRPFDEDLLFRVGSAYEFATEWHLQQPPPRRTKPEASNGKRNEIL